MQRMRNTVLEIRGRRESSEPFFSHRRDILPGVACWGLFTRLILWAM